MHGHHPNSRHHGEAHPLAKLTARKVRLMRRDHQNGWPLGHIARTFGVSISTASKAINRKTWRNI